VPPLVEHVCETGQQISAQLTLPQFTLSPSGPELTGVPASGVSSMGSQTLSPGEVSLCKVHAPLVPGTE
jgi:hypothetical protein